MAGAAGGGGNAGLAGSGAGGGSTGIAGSGGSSAGATGGNVGVAGAGGSAVGGNVGSAGMAGSGAGSGGTAGSKTIIVSVDFIGGSVPMGGTGGGMLVPAPAMGPTETAGVKPAMNWNGAATSNGTLSNLLEADGTVTAASVTWSSPSMGSSNGEWKNNYPDAPGNARMMNGYLDPPIASATVAVHGLPAAITAGGYDVYVYMAGDIPFPLTRTYQYTIGSTSFMVSQTGPSPASFSGFTLAPAGGAGNYVVFRNLTAATFTLTATPGTGQQTRAPVNGLQIVSPSGS
jgi:hypothetical protein